MEEKFIPALQDYNLDIVPGRFTPLSELVPGRFNPLSDELTEGMLESACEMGKKLSALGVTERDKVFALNLQRLQKCLTILSLPPRFTTVRVHLERITMENAIKALEGELDKQNKCLKKRIKYKIHKHKILQDLLAIESQGFLKVVPSPKQIIVSRLCGSSVLRGANVFAPGVLGAMSGIKAGNEVSVYADVDDKCLRGCKSYSGRIFFLGNGIALQGRSELFSVTKPVGVAVKMKEKVYDCPSIGDFRKDVFFLQNLPSVLCSHLFRAAENKVVLDMCAAPGGKTIHIAALVGNNGKIIAIDRSEKKVEHIKQNAEKWGLKNISAFVFNSTKIVSSDYCSLSKNKLLESDDESTSTSVTDLDVSENTCTYLCNSIVSSPPYQPSSFEWILLDAPCSALGQRPQIYTKMRIKELKSFPILQQKLLENAVTLLSPGGMLVYSTCTITVDENEKMVKWVLDKFRNVELEETVPKLGRPGLYGYGLDHDQCVKVQRFGPNISVNDDCDQNLSSLDSDTIGFFIAKFKKVS